MSELDKIKKTALVYTFRKIKKVLKYALIICWPIIIGVIVGSYYLTKSNSFLSFITIFISIFINLCWGFIYQDYQNNYLNLKGEEIKQKEIIYDKYGWFFKEK
jgi:uncharacterized membrane protein YfcA